MKVTWHLLSWSTKCVVISLFLLMFFEGCSQKNKSVVATPAGLPFRPIAITPPDCQEITNIQSQARALFTSKNFDKLEETATEFRKSPLCYSDGHSKLFYFYDALDSSEDANGADWSNHFAILSDWINAKPASITARVAMANEWIKYAWAVRGHDYADKVSDESWKLFFQRLNRAVVVLDEAATLNEKCPAWSVAMLRTQLGLQSDRSEYDKAFNAAIQSWPNYISLYCNRANYLLPRWYGADGELEKDLEQSANKIGGESGDVLYARVVWDVHCIAYSTNVFAEYNLSWNRTHHGFEALEKQYPNDLRLENEAAHLAVLGQDATAAKKYFDQTAGKVDLSCWSEEDYSNFASVVYSCIQ